MSVLDPLNCENCGRNLEADDAVSVIEGICRSCRDLSRLVSPAAAGLRVHDELVAGHIDLGAIAHSQNAGHLAATITHTGQIDINNLPPAESGVATLQTIESLKSTVHNTPSEQIRRLTQEVASDESGTQLRQTAHELEDRIRAVSQRTQAAKTRRDMALARIKEIAELKEAAEELAYRARLRLAAQPRPTPPTYHRIGQKIRGETTLPSIEIEEPVIFQENIPAAAATQTSQSSPMPTPRPERRFIPPQPEQFSRSFSSPTPSVPSIRARRRRRDLLVGTTLGLIVTAGIATYFFKHRPIVESKALVTQADVREFSLRISPRTAVVKLDGRVIGRPDETGLLMLPLSQDNLMGRILEVKAEGFHPVRQSLSDFNGSPEALIDLVREPYELAVNSTPPQAEVWINEDFKGYTPLSLHVEPKATSKLSIRREGFAKVTRELQAPEPGEKLTLDLNLVRAGLALMIEADPPGAQIKIDGQVKGQAPLRVELPSTYLSKQIEVMASAEGYEDSSTRVALPSVGGLADVETKLSLAPAQAKILVQTQPPGGRITVAGKDFGEAPVTLQFASQRIGQSVVIEASLAGTHLGRQEVTIPPANTPLHLNVSMAFNAQRIVFALASPTEIGAQHFVLSDRLTRQIQMLQPSQRFAVVAAADDGMETWPEAMSLESATSAQKVRAYDMIRSTRPCKKVRFEELLRNCLSFEPTTIWLFTEGPVDRVALEQFNRAAKDRQVIVNVVRASTSPEQSWLADWTASHHGTLSVIGRDPVSTIALDPNADHE